MKLLAFFCCFLYNGFTMYERKYPHMDELTNEVANELNIEIPTEVPAEVPVDVPAEATEEVMKEMPPVPVRRPRRKRSKFQIFKEAYLPVVIVALALILVITFMIGSISRAVTKNKLEKEASIAASESVALEEAKLQAEATRLLASAKDAADALDYQKAIDLIATFKGDISKYPELSQAYNEYVQKLSELVIYSDPTKVPHLSFQMLVADPERAFTNEDYGNSYNRNYVTTDEFEKILQQLYDNDFMLVSIYDLVERSEGNFYAGTVRLPVGKKPIVLSQVAANYFTYMTDGNDDGLPDKDGAGFPYCLALDGDGNFISKMIGADGNEVTGAYDFVTILEKFIAEHPDFSYQGARAVLAVTGYDGIFGYRINPEVRETQGSEYYAQQLSGAQKIVDALKDAGYDLACYSYENISYGDSAIELIQGDLGLWAEQVAGILGDVDILVYPYGDDIYDSMSSTYDGDKYNTLYNAGFRIFVGMDNMGNNAQVTNAYFRQTRRWVTGAKMAYASENYTDLFNPATVLNNQRGEVPADE